MREYRHPRSIRGRSPIRSRTGFERLYVSLRFEDAGDGVIKPFLLAFSPRDVAVMPVVSHHLFAPVRDVRTHRGQPFQRLQTVTLRSPGWDKSQMTLVDPKTGGPVARLLPQDKAKNASGLRRTIEPPEATVAASFRKDQPALLQKWLADYAATGLPPSYLPKEECNHD